MSDEEEQATLALCASMGIQITWYEEFLGWAWESDIRTSVVLYSTRAQALRDALAEHGVVRHER